jgi:glycosyltransferase involved in cell wall biosynthesis
MNESLKILLIIPCYNEERNIGKLLEEISKIDLKYDTLVIDDGSNDDTYRIAKTYSSAIRLVSNLGIGGAVQTAIRYAFRNNYDLCIQIDGDGQHPPTEIIKLIENYRQNSMNLIIGSRFMSLKSDTFKSTFYRRIGIKVISFTIKAMYNYQIYDPTSGFRLLDKGAMRLFSKLYPYDFPEPISIAIALNNGMRIGEVPVNMRVRENGVSSIKGIKTLFYMIRVICYVVLTRLGSVTERGVI